jgi:hypothetical protein
MGLRNVGWVGLFPAVSAVSRFAADCPRLRAGNSGYFLMWRLIPTRINGQRKIAKIAESTPRHPSMFLK